MKSILVKKSNRPTLVDDDDYERVSKYSWWLHNHGYVFRSTTVGKVADGTRRRKNYYLHREIMGSPDCQIDHIDRDKLNNQKSNLRLANNSENHFNATKRRQKFSSSKYKGVSRAGIYKATGKPRFQVFAASKYVGYFSSEIQAAKAYDEAVKKACPEFALTNF